MLVSTKKILYAIKENGFFGAHIVGPKGIGKTVYALLIAWETFHNLGYDENKSWRMALDNLLFTRQEIIDFLVRKTRKPKPIVIFDDIRVFLSGLSYFENPRETQLLMGLLDTARTSVNAILTTSPSLTNVLGFIKKDDDYLLRLTRANAYRSRIATGYSRYTLPSGTARVRKTYKDFFYCRLPDKVYQEAYRKRLEYRHIIMDTLGQKIKEVRDARNPS